MKNILVLSASVAVLLLLVAFSLSVGRYPVSLPSFISAIMTGSGHDPAVATVLFSIRLPRILGAVIVGGALSLAGAAYQGMFRNPMVSPDILGVSAGAGFGRCPCHSSFVAHPFVQASALRVVWLPCFLPLRSAEPPPNGTRAFWYWCCRVSSYPQSLPHLSPS